MRKIDRVEYENNQRKFESVYSTKVRAGKRRTYFFDVRKTKGDDYYITLTESTKRFDSDGYERHKIFLYKEDFNRFLTSLGGAIDHVKTELMPDYDYDEFTRRQEEWEIKRAAMDKEDAAAGVGAHSSPKPAPVVDSVTTENHLDTVAANTTSDARSSVPSDEVTTSSDAEKEIPAMDAEEVAPTTVVEETSPPVDSEKVNEISAEADEEDMSW